METNRPVLAWLPFMIPFLVFFVSCYGLGSVIGDAVFDFIPRDYGSRDEDGQFVSAREGLGGLLGAIAGGFALHQLSKSTKSTKGRGGEDSQGKG